MKKRTVQKLKRVLARASRHAAGAWLVCALAAAGTIGVRATEDIRKALEDARNRANATRSELNDARNNIDSLEAGREALQNNMNSLNDELYAVGQNLLSINDRIDDKRLEIEAMEEELKAASDLRETQYEQMKLRIQFIYERQDFVLADMLTQSSSLSEFINQGSYIEALSAYDREMLEQYKGIESQIAFQKTQLEAELQDLEGMQQEQVAEQEKFYGLISDVSENIVRYNNEISIAEVEAEAIRTLLAQQQAEVSDWEKKLQEQLKISQEARAGAWTSVDGLTFYEKNEMGISDLELLANVIYTESGNQPYEGQVGVGAVVINRMRSARFKQNTMYEVITAPGQFSVYPTFLQRSIDNGWATEACYKAARDAMSGYSTVGDCLFFCAPRLGPKENSIIIGGHCFY
ncbi:MAG: cell wall hydrolase [Lachnospiraceae bacterium]|nr:cell wall hydrolase [Lachnospiraceae bacterium]